MRYIGETKRRLKDRFNEHRRTIDNPKTKSKPTTAAEHFLSFPNHNANDMQLIPTEKIFSNRDSIRKATEAFLISKGITLVPHGLNIREETYFSFVLFGFLLLFSFNFTLSLLFFYHCYLSGWSPTYFLYYVNILLIKHTNVNFTSLYLKKAGLASRNIVHLLKFYLRCIGLCFYIFLLFTRLFTFIFTVLTHYPSLFTLPALFTPVTNPSPPTPRDPPLSLTMEAGFSTGSY